MNEKENTKILIDILRKVKANESRRVSKDELDHLDKNVKTIKEDVDKGRSVGYIVIGIDSKGRTNHACCGTSFMLEEMLIGLIEQIGKDNIPLVEAILERIKFELGEPNEDKPTVDAIKDSCSKGKLISYLVIGLSKNSDTVQVFEGSSFTAVETMSLFFEALIKDHKDLGEKILKRLKSDFDEKYPEEEDDDKN